MPTCQSVTAQRVPEETTMGYNKEGGGAGMTDRLLM